MMKATWSNGLVALVSITVGMWAAVSAPAIIFSDTFDTATSEDINSDLAGRQSGDFATRLYTLDRPNTGVGSLTQVRGAVPNEGLANTLWLRAETAGASFGETVVGMDVSFVPQEDYLVSFDMKRGTGENLANSVGFGLRSDGTNDPDGWNDDGGFRFQVRGNGNFLYREVGGSVIQVDAPTPPAPLSTDGNGFFNVSFTVRRNLNRIDALTIGGTDLGSFNLPSLTGRSDNIYWAVGLTGGPPQHAGIDNFQIVPEPSALMLWGLGGAVLLCVCRARRA